MCVYAFPVSIHIFFSIIFVYFYDNSLSEHTQEKKTATHFPHNNLCFPHLDTLFFFLSNNLSFFSCCTHILRQRAKRHRNLFSLFFILFLFVNHKHEASSEANNIISLPYDVRDDAISDMFVAFCRKEIKKFFSSFFLVRIDYTNTAVKICRTTANVFSSLSLSISMFLFCYFDASALIIATVFFSIFFGDDWEGKKAA